MAARKAPRMSAIGLTHGRSWPEELAEFTYQLLRRLGPEGMPGLQVKPTEAGGATIDERVSLETAPEWIGAAYARAKAGTDQGLSDAGARAFVARDRLLMALHRRGMKQADLARQLGKSPTSISRIFKAPQRSRVTTLQDIAAALGVELADILE